MRKFSKIVKAYDEAIFAAITAGNVNESNQHSLALHNYVIAATAVKDYKMSDEIVNIIDNAPGVSSQDYVDLER